MEHSEWHRVVTVGLVYVHEAVFRESHRDRAQYVLEMRQPCCAEYRRCHERPRSAPGKGHMDEIEAMAPGNVEIAVHGNMGAFGRTSREIRIQ